MSDIIGAFIGADATEDAADSQAAPSHEANRLQDKWFEQTRADNMPALEGRNAAIAQLMQLYGLAPQNTSAGLYGSLTKPFTGADLQNDPGYQFTRSEGMRGIRNDMAARGGLYSGATLKALDKFNTGLADTTFTNAFNRDAATKDRTAGYLGNLAGLTGGIVNNTQAAGGQAATNIGNNLISQGNNQAAAGLARGSLWSNAINKTISNGQQNGWWGLGGNSGIPAPDWAGGDLGSTEWWN